MAICLPQGICHQETLFPIAMVNVIPMVAIHFLMMAILFSWCTVCLMRIRWGAQIRTVESGAMTADQYGLPFCSEMTVGWQGANLQIANDELGHLVTVQNLLYLIGRPWNFEREDFSIRNEFDPFPF